MHLLPTHDEIVRVLRDTGALREGHFLYANGLHSNEFLQIPLAMRYYQHAKTFSVALSRLLRANPEIRTMIPELSIVSPATGGLPVAYGVCEALQAKQVYWAERDANSQADSQQPWRFRQFIEPVPGEQVVLVDDKRRSGEQLGNMKNLVESYGASGRRPRSRDLSAPRRSQLWRPASAPSHTPRSQLLGGRGILRALQEVYSDREGLGITVNPRQQTLLNDFLSVNYGTKMIVLNDCALCYRAIADRRIRAFGARFPQGFAQGSLKSLESPVETDPC